MYTVNLPCKPGDDFWWIDVDTMEIVHEKGGINGVAIYQDKHVEIVTADGNHSEVGTKWCCLTREEAEAVREKLMKK